MHILGTSGMNFDAAVMYVEKFHTGIFEYLNIKE